MSERRPASVLSRVVALLAPLAYVTLVEPSLLEVTRHQVTAPVDRPLLLAHVSDLHTDGLGFVERRLVEAVEQARPDLVVITGDTVDSGDLARAEPVLQRLRAPLGVFAVLGNWEHWRPPRSPRDALARAGVTLLDNEGLRLTPRVFLAGLDDALAGFPVAEAALAGAREGDTAVVLAHSPIAFDARLRPGTLMLAGHTHGGQVRLPFLPPLWLPQGSGRYVAGWYERDGARLYVSRGVGTSIARVRAFCRPELALISITPRPAGEPR